MLTCILLSAALSLGATPKTIVGKVRVTGTSFSKQTWLVVKDTPIELQGKQVDEIARLQSIKVELVGVYKKKIFEVWQYRIVDIGGGAKPMVGMLIEVGDILLLQDGGGGSIPLSMGPGSKRRMLRKVGSKLWVHGKKLVSGELKVTRYGILRPAKPKPKPEPQPKIDE